MYTALRLQKKLSRKAEITVVDPQSNMTYQPFLPEAAAGSLEPRHVVVPLRKILRRCRVITATVTRIEHARKAATVLPSEGEGYEIRYDLLVVCPGSVSRLLPIPGLAEHGIGFKTIGEAIYLRNHVLSRLDLAASVTDPERRRRALSFVFVGGGYAGVEAIAELQDMARYALRYVDSIDVSDMRWMLVEAATRIMPEVSVGLGAYTADRLAERGYPPVWSPWSTGMSYSVTAMSSMPRPWCGRLASKRTRCSLRPTCRATTRAGCRVTPISPCAISTTCSRPVTAPPSRICPNPTSQARCAVRVRNMRSTKRSL